MRALEFGVVPQILWPSTRESGSAIEEKGMEVEASRLRRYPRLLFANAVIVGDLVVRATFGLVEGRAESLSEDVNLEDDDVTRDPKKSTGMKEVSYIFERIYSPSAAEYGVESFLACSAYNISLSALANFATTTKLPGRELGDSLPGLVGNVTVLGNVEDDAEGRNIFSKQIAVS